LNKKLSIALTLEKKTQYSKFNPILYNPTNKKLETLNSWSSIYDGSGTTRLGTVLNPAEKAEWSTLRQGKFFDKFKDTTDIPDGCIFWEVGDLDPARPLIPFRHEFVILLNENKTVMMTYNGITCSIVLEDSTDKNLKQYSLIYNDEYIDTIQSGHPHLYKRENGKIVSYPDISKPQIKGSVFLYKRYNGKIVKYPEDIDYILKNYFSSPKLCLII